MGKTSFFFILGSPSHQSLQDITYRLPLTSTSPVHLIQSVHPDPNIKIPDVTLGLPPENYTFQGIFSSADYIIPEPPKNYSNSPLHSGNISPFTNSTSNSPIHQNLLYSSNNTSIYNPNPILYNCANFVAYNPCGAQSTVSSITQGLSGLNTTANPFQLELRSQPEEFKMETCSYSNVQASSSQSYIHQNPLNYILTTHNHRSLTNSPISNPGSPGLDMIQEESSCHHNTIQIPIKQDPVSVCHPQISVTDVSGSEVTLIASSDTSEDSMDSLDNQKPQKIPSFIISEPAENQPSITRGIGRKTSSESNSEQQKFEEEHSEYYLRRNSDKSSCYSDDSLSNDSLSVGNFSPSSVSMQQPSTESDFGNPINQNFEKMQITHHLDNTDTALDLSMPHSAPVDLETGQQCASSNLATTLFNINQNLFDNAQKHSGSFEMQLSEVCSKLKPNDILELVKQTINNQIPPKHCVTKSAEEDYSDKLSLEYEGGLQIELKICEDKQRESKGLKVRRISGDHLVYNQLCQQLISCMTVS